MMRIADKWASDVSTGASIAKVAISTLNGRLDAVLHYLPLAALQPDDPENVHQLRVWTRRATAALRLYEHLVPKRQFAWLQKALRRIRRAANDARDCDVLIGRLTRDNRNGTHAWLDGVRTERAEAQAEILHVHERLFRDDRLERKVEKLLEKVAAHGKRPSGKRRFRTWARSHLARELKHFHAAVPAPDADDSVLHRFRICAKGLRYTIELLAGAFAPELRNEIYPLIESIQDRLGEINDHATARDRLEAQATRVTNRSQRANWNRLRDREQTRLEQAQRGFWRWCTPARLRRLKRQFEKILQSAPTATD
jgi:CHAD domain-containing protein